MVSVRAPAWPKSRRATITSPGCRNIASVSALNTLADVMAVYRTTFPIDAPSEVVWSALADFERYSEWNPSLPSIVGDLRVGSTVSLTLAMPGRPSPKVKAQLTEVVPQRRLTWHGNVGADWLFAGDREFVIDAGDDDAVRFTHVENVHGVLFPVFRLSWEVQSSATMTGSTRR